MITKHRLLSIDAWADGESWTWNQWYNLGMIEVDLDGPYEDILKFLVDEGRLKTSEGVDIEDDEYNLVVVDLDNNRMPMYAIEYGNTL